MLQAACSLIVFVVITFCPLYISYLFVRRYYVVIEDSVKWAAVAVLYLCLIVLIFTISAHLHIFTRRVVTFSCLALAVIARLVWRPKEGMLSGLKLPVNRLRQALSSKGAILFCAAAVSVLILAVKALLMPPLSYDSLTYHLFTAGSWIQNKGTVIFSVPDVMDGNCHFPPNAHIPLAWLMLPFRGDLLVSLADFPFLFAGALGLYALGREFKLDRGYSLILACAVCFSPMLYGYAATAYTDIQVFAELTCAVLFLFRYLRTRQKREAILLFLCLGLAAGAKYTALPLVALICCIFWFSLFRDLFKRRGLASFLSLSIICLGALIVLAGEQYIINWLETGNPLYSWMVSIGKRDLFSRFAFDEKILTGVKPSNIYLDLNNLAYLFSYSPSYAPRTAGPKFLLFAIAALSSLFFIPPRHSRNRVWVLTLIWMIPLVFFYTDKSPMTVLVRRFCYTDTPRFLSVPLGIMSLAAMVQLNRFYPASYVIKICLSAFVIIDLFMGNYKQFDNTWIYVFLSVLVLTVCIFTAIWKLRNIEKSRRAPFTLLVSISMFVISAAAVYKLQDIRDRTRWDYFKSYVDLETFPRQFVDGWKRCDDPGQPKTIALTTGWDPGGNWFFYPLMGRRLQNRVVYCGIDRKGIFSSRVKHEAAEANGDFDAWLYNLRLQKVDLIFIQKTSVPVPKQWPIEAEWVFKNPGFFNLEYEGNTFRIYKFSG